MDPSSGKRVSATKLAGAYAESLCRLWAKLLRAAAPPDALGAAPAWVDPWVRDLPVGTHSRAFDRLHALGLTARNTWELLGNEALSVDDSTYLRKRQVFAAAPRRS